MIQLQAEEILVLKVKCEVCREVKQGPDGYLRVIPIAGGSFTGKIAGEVVAGGADWNTQKENNLSHVFAKYMLKTNDGEYIAIENEGFIHNKREYNIKTVPRFTADQNGRYAWLNSGVYVGNLESTEEGVIIHIFQMR